MPAKADVDYDEIKALYVKGISLKDLADKYGLDYASLRVKASRDKWSATLAQARQMLSQTVNRDLQLKASGWLARMDSYVNRTMDSVERRDPDSLEIKDFKMLVETAKIVNDMARPTYGLNDGQQHQTNILVVPDAAHHAASRLPGGQVIDVQPLADATTTPAQPQEPQQPS